MRKIIVTGGKGQLGKCIKEVAEKYATKQDEFIYVDYNELDITNYDAVEKYIEGNSEELFAVVNCAAYTNVNNAESDRENAWKVNALGPKYLAIACHKRGVRLIQISTDFVFGEEVAQNFPYEPEVSNLHSDNVYGQTKAEGENNIIQVYGEDKNYAIVRTAWLYSEYGKNFCKTILERIKNGETCNVVDDQVGTPTYAKDLALFIIISFLFKTPSHLGKIFHYTNEGVASWYDFARYIEVCYNDIVGNESDNRYEHSLVNPRSTTNEELIQCKRPRYSVLSKTETRESLGRVIIPNWMVSVRKCVNNLINNKKGEE